MPTTDAQMITFFGRASITITARELTNIRDSLTAGRNLLDGSDNPRAATNDDVIVSLHQSMVNNTLGYLKQTDRPVNLDDVRVAPTP